MSNGLTPAVVTVVFPIIAAGWAVCAVGWVWELFKSHRRRLDSRVMSSPSTDGLFQVEGRTPLRSRSTSLLPIIATSPTTPDMRFLAATTDHGVTTDTSAFLSTDSDSLPQFVLPAEVNNPHFPRISDANQPPQAGAPPDTPTPTPSRSADAISLISSSTIPPSYHTRHSSRDLHFFPISRPVPPGSPQEPPTPPPALVPEGRPRQSRVRGPRSRGTSRTLLRYMAQSDPPPLPWTGGGDPFADGRSVVVRAGGTVPDGQGTSDRRPQLRQAVDGGVRLAGGPLDNGGFVGEQWDYLLSS
ncbi:hypothetical protein LXA43DRAFT_316523 [Ganoderma leucocontextum]|nr:hypothetical protein LXA43DRAFT_316523 [Ganoderma leucocontextum]